MAPEINDFFAILSRFLISLFTSLVNHGGLHLPTQSLLGMYCSTNESILFLNKVQLSSTDLPKAPEFMNQSENFFSSLLIVVKSPFLYKYIFRGALLATTGLSLMLNETKE